MSTTNKRGTWAVVWMTAALGRADPCVAQKPLSPEGHRLVYYAATAEDNHDLFLIDLGGPPNPRQLTETPEHEYNPSWHPDGQSILYHAGAGDVFDLFVLDLQSGKRRRVTDTPHHDADGVFSPDGSHIAFNSDRDGDHEIFVCAADGTAPIQLTRNETADFSPHWSPDGERIAYVSRTGESAYDIFLTGRDGTGTRRLTRGGAELYRPVWSPDGTRLVLMGRRGGSDFDVYILDVRDSGEPEAEPVKLTESPSDDDTPFWLPDGRVAFFSDREGTSTLFTMTAEGDDVRAWVEIPAPR